MRAFAIALLAAALLAFTPLKVAFCARAGERTGAALGVFPLAGGVALRLSRARAGKRKRPRRKPKKRPDALLLIAVGRRLLKRMRVEELRAQGEVGLADAAATALAVGLLQAFVRAVGAASGARVVLRVRPRFSGAESARRGGGHSLPARGAYCACGPWGHLRTQQEACAWKGIPLRTS